MLELMEATRAKHNKTIRWGNGSFLVVTHGAAVAALFFSSWTAVAVALFAFGGLGVMLWGVFLRVTIGLHATWLVNSATHLWDRRRFVTSEDSRNSWWVALLTFGEGWHNNHHAFPTSARHGLRWYEVDFNWWGIRSLQLIGLARAIKRVQFNGNLTGWRLTSR